MKISHYICEDVRQELNGKITLVGLYPNDCLLLPEIIPQDQQDNKFITTMDKVMLLLNITDYIGEVNVDIEILKPDGTQHGKFETIGKLEVLEGKSANAIINMQGFPVPIVGTYIIRAKVNDVIYEIPLRIGILDD